MFESPVSDKKVMRDVEEAYEKNLIKPISNVTPDKRPLEVYSENQNISNIHKFCSFGNVGLGNQFRLMQNDPNIILQPRIPFDGGNMDQSRAFNLERLPLGDITPTHLQ